MLRCLRTIAYSVQFVLDFRFMYKIWPRCKPSVAPVRNSRRVHIGGQGRLSNDGFK